MIYKILKFLVGFFGYRIMPEPINISDVKKMFILDEFKFSSNPDLTNYNSIQDKQLIDDILSQVEFSVVEDNSGLLAVIKYIIIVEYENSKIEKFGVVGDFIYLANNTMSDTHPISIQGSKLMESNLSL